MQHINTLSIYTHTHNECILSITMKNIRRRRKGLYCFYNTFESLVGGGSGSGVAGNELK